LAGQNSCETITQAISIPWWDLGSGKETGLHPALLDESQDTQWLNFA